MFLRDIVRHNLAVLEHAMDKLRKFVLLLDDALGKVD